MMHTMIIRRKNVSAKRLSEKPRKSARSVSKRSMRLSGRPSPSRERALTRKNRRETHFSRTLLTTSRYLQDLIIDYIVSNFRYRKVRIGKQNRMVDQQY